MRAVSVVEKYMTYSPLLLSMYLVTRSTISVLWTQLPKLVVMAVVPMLERCLDMSDNSVRTISASMYSKCPAAIAVGGGSGGVVVVTVLDDKNDS